MAKSGMKEDEKQHGRTVRIKTNHSLPSIILRFPHESQIRKRPHQQIHEPAKVRVPAYHPGVSEVRQDWAQYYDKLTGDG